MAIRQEQQRPLQDGRKNIMLILYNTGGQLCWLQPNLAAKPERGLNIQGGGGIGVK